MLENRCAGCGGTTQLEVDHINGTTWDLSRKSSHQRMQIYLDEAKRGLIQLLCGPCNKAKGRPDSEGNEKQKPSDGPF